MDNQPPQASIIMKAGSHVGECLDCILERKKRERKLDEKKRIFWGYGGNRLLPKRVQRFARQWDKGQVSIQLLMPLTRKEEQARSRREKNPESANHQCQPKIDLRAVEYSKDKEKWDTVHKKINVPVSKYALVLDEIKPVDMKLDRHKFKVGIGPSKGRNATKYGRKYWFDHVCLEEVSSMYIGPYGLEDPIVTIKYQAHLVEPYAVFLK